MFTGPSLLGRLSPGEVNQQAACRGKRGSENLTGGDILGASGEAARGVQIVAIDLSEKSTTSKEVQRNLQLAALSAAHRPNPPFRTLAAGDDDELLDLAGQAAGIVPGRGDRRQYGKAGWPRYAEG